MPEWILGLDGGGTKTLLAVANRSGEVLEVIAGAGINPFDQPTWQTELTRILNQVSIHPDQLAFSSFGMPGYGESDAVSALQREAARGWAGERCEVQNDVAVAFRGALAGQPGVLVLAGTGSMAWGENTTHRVARVGGWGEGFGDEGSAHWIGVQALQKLSWSIDGRLSDSEFRRGLLEHIGIKDSELISWFYSLSHPRPKIAALAKAVDNLSGLGNLTAKHVLIEAAQHLTQLGFAAQKQLKLEQTSFSFAGSVFKSLMVRETVKHKLSSLGTWLEPCGTPLAGALLDAAQNAGWDVDKSWLKQINFSLGRKPS
jgi:glucosamine kinase